MCIFAVLRFFGTPCTLTRLIFSHVFNWCIESGGKSYPVSGAGQHEREAVADGLTANSRDVGDRHPRPVTAIVMNIMNLFHHIMSCTKVSENF